MIISLIVLHCLLILLGILPFIQNQHWVFRVPEFMKLQIFLLQILLILVSCFFFNESKTLWILFSIQILLLGYHIFILMRYTKFWRTKPIAVGEGASNPVKIISCNVYQFNQEYQLLIDLIEREQPDILLTMESNGDWEKALRAIEKDYPTYEKVTLENTYGMHFYTKLKVNFLKTHYFVADDLPSIEAELETNDGHRFVLFGVHPPPPSPTEEETAKERDGDLLSVAKKVRDYKLPVVITGDFNNVAWAKSSLLFKKTSRLIDARIGRGILATFHAKYFFFRVPLDLLFHSADVFIDDLKIYPSVGSDHFPMGCTFHINLHNDAQEDEIKELEKGEMKEVNKLIAEGKEEESDNREAIVTEE
jgi:endonuclease/exonuclease/phosphatase (EEP) superfamily protein YafD